MRIVVTSAVYETNHVKKKPFRLAVGYGRHFPPRPTQKQERGNETDQLREFVLSFFQSRAHSAVSKKKYHSLHQENSCCKYTHTH